MLCRVLHCHMELLGFVLSLVTISGLVDGETTSSFGPTRHTTKGRIRGLRVNVHGTDVDMYLGIPYAKPPIGNLRFRHPLPADHWPDVKNTTQKPNACEQAIDTVFTNHSGPSVWNANTPLSEDCLYLNVWEPRTKSDGYSYEKHVMVWIFGGGFFSGSSSLDIYDGRYLAAENDVIVVSMQYRVGALGFLSLFHPEAPGNAGLFDQVLALDWVQQNIHFFGGNPHSVTLFGESAGAASVGMHMLSPLSRGKFHRVILQSGAPHAAWAILPEKDAKNRSLKLAEKLGCNIKSEVADVINCLRTKTANEIYSTEWDGIVPYGVVRFPIVPVVDGAFLTETPEKALKYGHIKKCPVLLGHNLHEANYWMLYYNQVVFPIDEQPRISQAQFDKVLDDFFFFHPHHPIQLSPIGKEAITFQYRHWLNPDDQVQNAKQLDHAVGDYNFICPTVDFAMKAASLGNEVVFT